MGCGTPRGVWGLGELKASDPAQLSEAERGSSRA